MASYSDKSKKRALLLRLWMWAGRIANAQKRKWAQKKIIEQLRPPKTD